jgi:hypothetical protein
MLNFNLEEIQKGPTNKGVLIGFNHRNDLLNHVDTII